MEGVTRLTGLISLNLYSNNLTSDDAARLISAAAAAGFMSLQKLNLLGNLFDTASVVQCEAWRMLSLPQPPHEVVRQGFDSLIQYLLSEDKVATNTIRIFVVGESTVRLFVSLPFFRSFVRIACALNCEYGSFFVAFFHERQQMLVPAGSSALVILLRSLLAHRWARLRLCARSCRLPSRASL